MNRATFLTTLAGGAFALPTVAREETPDERAIYDLLDAAVDAQFTYDFSRLVTLLHPASTKMFRNVQSARFDQLMKLFPTETVLSVIGLPHPKDIPVSDSEFFVAACEQARTLNPDFVGDSKYLPLQVHGSIFAEDGQAFVVYSYSGTVQTTRTDFDYIRPCNMTFYKRADTWLIYSTFLCTRVADVWWYEACKSQNAAHAPEPIK